MKAGPLCQVYGVGSAQEVEETLASGSERAFKISPVGEGRGFVEQRPIGNPVTQSLCNELRIIGKAGGGVAIWPAASVFQGLGQVPVVERDKRTNSRLQQGVNETAVIIYPIGVSCAGTAGLDAGPGDRESVTVQIEHLHERDV